MLEMKYNHQRVGDTDFFVDSFNNKEFELYRIDTDDIIQTIKPKDDDELNEIVFLIIMNHSTI